MRLRPVPLRWGFLYGPLRMRRDPLCDGKMDPALLRYALSGTPSRIAIDERRTKRTIKKPNGQMVADGTVSTFWMVSLRGAYIEHETKIDEKSAREYIAAKEKEEHDRETARVADERARLESDAREARRLWTPGDIETGPRVFIHGLE